MAIQSFASKLPIELVLKFLLDCIFDPLLLLLLLKHNFFLLFFHLFPMYNWAIIAPKLIKINLVHFEAYVFFGDFFDILVFGLVDEFPDFLGALLACLFNSRRLWLNSILIFHKLRRRSKSFLNRGIGARSHCFLGSKDLIHHLKFLLKSFFCFYICRIILFCSWLLRFSQNWSSFRASNFR